MSTTTTPADTDLSNAHQWADVLAECVGKVAAGRGCSLEQAMELVLVEVARTDPVRLAKTLQALELVRQAA